MNNPKYVPKTLSRADRLKQIDSIQKGTVRPQLASFRSRRSNHVVDFEKRYKGHKVSDVGWIHQNLMTRRGIEKVLAKGRAAYYTSGSRPNQTPTSWARARLASVLLGRGAFKVDRHIALKHGRRKWLESLGITSRSISARHKPKNKNKSS